MVQIHRQLQWKVGSLSIFQSIGVYRYNTLEFMDTNQLKESHFHCSLLQWYKPTSNYSGKMARFLFINPSKFFIWNALKGLHSIPRLTKTNTYYNKNFPHTLTFLLKKLCAEPMANYIPQYFKTLPIHHKFYYIMI